MDSSNRSTVYLRDYLPPSHEIIDVRLVFELSEAGARVTSTLRLRAVRTDSPKLVLHGDSLKLEKIHLDGREPTRDQYHLDAKSLTLSPEKPEFTLEIQTWIEPQNNLQLSGLYRSKDLFCTQCEAEGFRRITYFLDRPDAMTTFTTTIRADSKKYPVLLSNGNKVSHRQIEGGLHEATWHDPHKKPSYLFALVAGDLVCTEDFFVTQSGRRVTLQIFVDKGNESKVAHAMLSLKKAMRWDEEVYGREYDLDIFMIVAVDDFNAGAMENKGLNIFNSKYILASPETATDKDYEAIESVVAHEYFHNWTGNRITCRDWFQLSLKEGLTVFRDQEFSADRHSRAVKRIEDVNRLRTYQFAEDAGPMAHPIRPQSYIEINNFYTLTVYEKGAEVIRMIHTLLGPQKFRAGMDKYFELFDGQAVTTEDFVHAMELASGRDLTTFKNWYNQAGTPVIDIEEAYDVDKKSLRLTVRQSCRPTPETTQKLPFTVPLRTALVTSKGVERETILELTENLQSFNFEDVQEKPVVSHMRGFSAPVELRTQQSSDELLFLLSRDNDAFVRWNSLQQLWDQWIIPGANGQPKPIADLRRIVSSVGDALSDHQADPALRALLLAIPAEEYYVGKLSTIDVLRLHETRQTVQKTIATQLSSLMGDLFHSCQSTLSSRETSGYDSENAALRSLKNSCLFYLTRWGSPEWEEVAFKQLHSSANMTDQFSALTTIMDGVNPRQEEASEWFRERWQNEYLVMTKWLAANALVSHSSTLRIVQTISENKKLFDKTNPNNVYSLLRAFAQQNVFGFHSHGADAYEFLTNQILEIDKLNPQVASRVVSAFNHWRKFNGPLGTAQQTALQRIVRHDGLSRNVYEVVSRALTDN